MTDFHSDDDEVFIDYMVDNYGDSSLDPEPPTCPFCGRVLDGEEAEAGLCDSDDCPRYDEELLDDDAFPTDAYDRFKNGEQPDNTIDWNMFGWEDD